MVCKRNDVANAGDGNLKASFPKGVHPKMDYRSIAKSALIGITGETGKA